MKVSLKYLTTIAISLVLVLPAMAAQSGDLSTVNKSINLDDNSTIGDVESVNGSIEIGANSTVESIDSVNGSIKLGTKVSVKRDIEAVNGAISLEAGCEVGGDVDTVNGGIKLSNSMVSGDISTVNGEIRVLNGSEVGGNVVVRKSNGWSWNKKRKPVKVEIGENVQIHGDLIFEHAVKLKLHDSAKTGEIIGDDVEIIETS